MLSHSDTAMDVAEQSREMKMVGCFERMSSLTVDDVYEIAKLVGSEVEKVIDTYGRASVEGLVPKVVKVLELLERFAAWNQTLKSKEEDLLKAFETLHLQQQKIRGFEENARAFDDEGNTTHSWQDWQQKEQKWRVKVDGLQAQVVQLQKENKELFDRLEISLSKEDLTHQKEREVMLKLKEVVDRQRDELRAKTQEISKMSKEVEALQEQLERFMKMNTDLRHKQSMMHTQLKSTVERRTDLEADLCEKQKEIERLTKQLEQINTKNPASTSTMEKNPATDLTDKMIIDLKDPNRPCFTKQEVREILFERNELKANLFLMQEEIAYYQREIMNDERCPGFLMEAVRSTIKKQRTVIKAKMLGIPEDECSSDEEKGPLFERRGIEHIETDSTDSRPPESRIRNLFGFLTRSSSGKSPSPQTSSSAWEIINADEQEPEVEEEPKCSP